MLCYRCGSHVPDTAEICPACGQKLSGGGLRQATGTFSRRRASTGQIEGAPYRPQELVANRYLVKDVVGVGPLGYVFRAHDKEIDVEVALKVINPKLVQSSEERKQFARQIRLARKLSHPNLVRVYEEGEDQDRPYFTSQFLDGLTLRKIIDLRLQKGQFFALHEIEPILMQVCNALEGAHKVGPHSDVKPDNVLVLPDLLKVTDFGLGLAMPRLPFVQAMKARKADRYLSPELIEGGEIDGRADIYAVGVVLGEMLSGLTPDGSIPELQRRNPDVPQGIEGMYRKAINSNPLARFKTPAEFIGEFSELVRKVSPPPPPVRPEAASGLSPAARPRTATGMLQLQPRTPLKPPPPVPELPPPPPPVSGEHHLPDATQPIDPEQLDAVLRGARPRFDDNREETAVIDSGQFVASLDDDVETKALVETVPPPPPNERPAVPAPPSFLVREAQGAKFRLWPWVVLLALLGVGLGAAGGFTMIQKQKAATEAQRRDAEEKARQAQADARARADAEAEAARLAAQTALTPAPLPTANPPVAPTPALDEKARAERLLAEKRAAEQKAAEEKARADAEKKAADEKARADALAAQKAAAEEKARQDAEKKRQPVGPAVVVAPSRSTEGCPDGMKLVGAGAFRMGTPANDQMRGFDEKTLASVDVPAYCVDLFEYPGKRGVAPTASVSFADAKRLCESGGKRLCTEAEWEKACKGPGMATWPWGNSFDSNACNTEDDSGEARALAVTGKFGKCRSGYGVADLAGNVAEWTAEHFIKGGSFASGDYAVRCSARKNGASFAKSSEVGFRCCSDPH